MAQPEADRDDKGEIFSNSREIPVSCSSDRQPESGRPVDELESIMDRRKSERVDGKEPLHEFDRVFGQVDAALDVSLQPSDVSPIAGVVTDVDEFSRALVEVGVIGEQELLSFSGSFSEGMLSLARALIAAGKLTPYQAAAVYQRKSRDLFVCNYIILDRLRRGGTGTAFRVRHRLHGRIGVLKLLPGSFGRDRADVTEYRRVINSTRRMAHPNLVAAFDVGLDHGIYYVVMPYIEGRDLERLIRERGPMPVEQTIDCLTQAARGLGAAHAQGIVHGDVKPAKLMLDPAGTVRVLDLGLARAVAAADLGPAVPARRADPRDDVYSLGWMLYYLLTGHAPLEWATDSSLMTAPAVRPGPGLRAARPDVSPKLESVFLRMTATQPDERPGSMAEVIGLLESCQAPGDEPKPAGNRPKIGAEPMVADERRRTREEVPEPESDLSRWLRRPESEGLPINRELSLEDLMMEVRLDAPSPPPRPPQPVIAKSGPLRRRPSSSRASRPQITVVLVAAAALTGLAAVVLGVAWLSALNRSNFGPPPERGLPPAEPTTVNKKTNDRTSRLTRVPPPSQTRWETKTIFDGTSGQNWMLLNRKPLPPAHRQADGLNPHGTGSYLVVYRQKLADFVLDFDYKLTKGCNSGVFLRVSDLNDPINTGLEVALDDTSGTGFHDAGAIDDLVAPTTAAQLPPGTWNHMTVSADGPRISVMLNGTRVSAIDLDEWTRPGKRPDGSAHKYKTVAVASLARSGYVGFQDHGRDCWFRNIVLKSPSTSNHTAIP
jgi:serine/threonine protein kinase